MTPLSFLDVVKTRRSTRRFENKAVPISLIESVIELATYAPTNCNQQLWNFIVVTDTQLKQHLINEAASSTLIGRAPVIIVVSYDNWNYKEAIQGGAIAVQNMLLAATYYGLGCLSMNSYGNDEKIKEILNMPANQQICCFVLLGYAAKEDSTASSVPRRPVQEVLHINYFDKQAMLSKPYDPESWSLNDLTDWQEYYCRKTFLGKEMDIMHKYEKDLIKKKLAESQGPLLDLLSYDGCYVRELPKVKVVTADLCKPTQAYTCEATKNLMHIFPSLLDLKKKQVLGVKEKFKTITLLYKFERLSKELQESVIETGEKYLAQDGKFVIISRKHNFFFTAFYYVIRWLFGNDVRKTGIYAFFGPYKPLCVWSAKKLLKKHGFKVSQSAYFFIPAFFDQALQMFLQYKRSGGSSYLHRIRRENWLTRLLSSIIELQGLRKTLHGSVVVFECRKK